MKFVRALIFMLLGAMVMVGTLLYVSQFFGGGEEPTPVIWLERE